MRSQICHILLKTTSVIFKSPEVFWEPGTISDITQGPSVSQTTYNYQIWQAEYAHSI